MQCDHYGGIPICMATGEGAKSSCLRFGRCNGPRQIVCMHAGTLYYCLQACAITRAFRRTNSQCWKSASFSRFSLVHVTFPPGSLVFLASAKRQIVDYGHLAAEEENCMLLQSIVHLEDSIILSESIEMNRIYKGKTR